MHAEPPLVDTTNTAPTTLSADLAKESELFMRSSMPSATDILHSANEAQQAKAKLKAGGHVKMKTFYGGEVIKDVRTLNLATPPPGTRKASFRLNPTCAPRPAPSPPQRSDEFFEFVGACVKLEKSSLSACNFGESLRVFGASPSQWCLSEVHAD